MESDLKAQLDRCDAEILRCEAELRGGHLEVDGLCLGLKDWSAERRLILAMIAKKADPAR